jgi:hypothetical protein
VELLAKIGKVELLFPIIVICLTVFRIRAERRQTAVMESLAEVLFREADFLAKESDPVLRLGAVRKIRTVAQILNILAS